MTIASSEPIPNKIAHALTSYKTHMQADDVTFEDVEVQDDGTILVNIDGSSVEIKAEEF